jgi:DNA-binding transcriptional LysR family regulator
MRAKGAGTRIAIERRFAEHGNITLHPRLGLGRSEAVKQAILAGLGISALSRHALSLNQQGQFTVLDVERFPILRHLYAVYPAGRQLSVVARAFLDYLLARGMRRLLQEAGRNSQVERTSALTTSRQVFQRRKGKRM